jgi:hypothetical protein
MGEYLAAQSVLFEDKPPKTLRDYAKKSFFGMLCIARDRLGHALDEEFEEAAAEILEPRVVVERAEDEAAAELLDGEPVVERAEAEPIAG